MALRQRLNWGRHDPDSDRAGRSSQGTAPATGSPRLCADRTEFEEYMDVVKLPATGSGPERLTGLGEAGHASK
ncbi:MAG: hypothetical protein J2P34_04250 [Actinobacteria bacterium]|nr:hypothetical protein [Actinomycetota bacterium]